MTNKRSRLRRLEQVVDLELEARARAVLGLDAGSITWPEFAREYGEVCERHEAIRKRFPQSPEERTTLADLQPEARMLAQNLGLDFGELMAEAEHIAARGAEDRQAVSWLLSYL